MCRNAWGLPISAVCMFRQGFSPNVTLPQKVKGKIDIPQEDEITAFYRAIKGTKLEVPFLLATQCGLRASEIAGLRKADVDPVQERITICQARVTGERGATVKAPKSYAGYRDLPCARRICAMAVASSDAEFVTEMDANAISGAWAKFVRRGNDLSVYGFHALRHYFASKAALTGVPKEYLVELMGHSSSKMLDQVYLHMFRTEKQRYAQIIAKQAMTLLDADATQNAT
jgi:integrase